MDTLKCLCCVFSFIRLADYLIVNTMHVLAVNSVSTLLNYLSEQLQNTPTLAQIQGLEEEGEKKEEKEEKKPTEDKSGEVGEVEKLRRCQWLQFRWWGWRKEGMSNVKRCPVYLKYTEYNHTDFI